MAVCSVAHGRRIALAIVILTFSAATAEARRSENNKTVAYIEEFRRHVTRSSPESDSDPRLHTFDLAARHLDLWREWNKTHEWPRVAVENSWPERDNRRASYVVVASRFPYPETCHDIRVDSNGRLTRFGAEYNLGDEVASYLHPQQMQRLHELLSSLPPSRKVLKLTDVLLISGRRKGRWCVRMYSWRHRPRVVNRLLKLIKEYR
jgi:hypothetical protein